MTRKMLKGIPPYAFTRRIIPWPLVLRLPLKFHGVLLEHLLPAARAGQIGRGSLHGLYVPIGIDHIEKFFRAGREQLEHALIQKLLEFHHLIQRNLVVDDLFLEDLVFMLVSVKEALQPERKACVRIPG
jgi:hypothetical protein